MPAIDRVAIGRTVGGDEVYIPLNESILVTGLPNSGKTNTCMNLLKNYSTKGNAASQAIILDFQRTVGTAAAPRFVTAYQPETQFTSLLAFCVDEIDRRANYLSSHPTMDKVPISDDMPRWLIYIEEFNSLVSSMGAIVKSKDVRNEIMARVAYIQRVGRKYGFIVCLSCQSALQESIGSTAFRSLCGTKVVHKLADGESIKAASGLSDPSELPSAGLLKGEFYVSSYLQGGNFLKARSESPKRLDFSISMTRDSCFKRVPEELVERGF